ncbi:hypothetical protein ZEAMMB73_Zm00001d003881 [Zea mays]|uniref:Uncharacterized protein n=1 Tax=Zea mays TaxID=4577 RepID=A0A1D6EC34_MAIZE|nr:hypothetical protein ZEAMMB73_Zm00001d003881 [Zea mays]
MAILTRYVVVVSNFAAPKWISNQNNLRRCFLPTNGALPQRLRTPFPNVSFYARLPPHALLWPRCRLLRRERQQSQSPSPSRLQRRISPQILARLQRRQPLPKFLPTNDTLPQTPPRLQRRQLTQILAHFPSMEQIMQ